MTHICVGKLTIINDLSRIVFSTTWLAYSQRKISIATKPQKTAEDESVNRSQYPCDVLYVIALSTWYWYDGKQYILFDNIAKITISQMA